MARSEMWETLSKFQKFFFCAGENKKDAGGGPSNQMNIFQ